MKKIILIRHAKSDWAIEGIKDIDRPLNARGYGDARKMGAFISENPDITNEADKIPGNQSRLFVSSPAIRAMTTAFIFADETRYDKSSILILPALYDTEPGTYFQCILNCTDQINTLFIFGHNPTISEVVSRLTGMPYVDLPTCSVSLVSVHADHWKDLEGAKMELKSQFLPKLLWFDSPATSKNSRK
jgi:phosphohistidine phosphatase